MVCVAALLTTAVCTLPTERVSAETFDTETTAVTEGSNKREDGYRHYLEQYQGKAKPVSSIIIPAADTYRPETDDTVAEIVDGQLGEDHVLAWTSATGKIAWKFTVPQEGLYAFRMQYLMLNRNAPQLEMSLSIDGESPFLAAENLIFPQAFVDETEIGTDSRGNDIRPKQISVAMWLNESAGDREGTENDAFLFYLSEGQHTVSLESLQAQVVIKQLEFYNQAALPTYQEYAASATIENGVYADVIEAENALYKSASMLSPIYDRTSPDTSPSDPVCLKYNTIGGSRYASQGLYIVWEVTAPRDGYYRLGLRVRQNGNRGLNSYRRLYINDEVPFKEAQAIPFPFSEDWQNVVLGDESGEWLFRLKEGTNTIRLEVVPGTSADLSAALSDVVYELNYLYRKLIAVTGVNPDPYRDYQIERDVPGALDAIKSIRAQVADILDAAQALGNQTTGALSSIEQMVVLLDGLIDKPNTIALRVSRLKDRISALSSLMLTLQSHPLEVDYLAVGEQNASLFKARRGWLDKLSYSVQAFLGTFWFDYSTIGDSKQAAETIDVWVQQSRDQANVLKSLTDSMFTPEYNIAVNVSLVQQSLVQAALSGRGPDVVVFAGPSEPINLAFRNAMEPLDQYPNFKEITQRFSKYAMSPYYYNGSTYALPVQENFYIMFYRTDIFEELGLSVPKTWTEFYRMVQVLQRSNMTAGVPNMPVETQMQADISVFATLLAQNGGRFYNDELSATCFTTEEAVEAFQQWTSLYKDYGLPYQFDFYNRFRSGEMPIGISYYTMYNQLSAAAPEIRGLWDFAPVPGTVQEDGTVNNRVCGSGACAVLFKDSENKDAAWKFMDWFTGKDAQVAYGLELESLLGPVGRYATANLEAFDSLPWNNSQRNTIKQQWESVFHLEQVPGGYFVDRNITNAFRKVVFKQANARETLIEYNKVINTEITRKRKDFGLE